jgi:hypothetical protein
MSRQLKPLKVDTIRLTIGGDVPLYLNRNTQQFYAVYMGQTVKAESADVCKRELRSLVERLANADLMWQQFVIIEKISAHHLQHSALELVARRVEVAQFAGQWLQRIFRTAPGDPQPNTPQELEDIAQEDARAAATPYPHFTPVSDAYRTVLPYTPELWDLICCIQRGLGRIHMELADRVEVSSRDGFHVDQLSSMLRQIAAWGDKPNVP